MLRALLLAVVLFPACFACVGAVLVVGCCLCAWFSPPPSAESRLPLRLRGGFDLEAALASDFQDFEYDLGNDDAGDDDAEDGAAAPVPAAAFGDAAPALGVDTHLPSPHDAVPADPAIEDLFFGLFASAAAVEPAVPAPVATTGGTASLAPSADDGPGVEDLFFRLFAPAVASPPAPEGLAGGAAVPPAALVSSPCHCWCWWFGHPVG